MSASPKKGLITERKASERYDVSVRTLSRWDEVPELNFPPAILIRGRRYRDVERLDAWDLANARKATKERAKCRRAVEHEETTAV
jgi:hypothetical protein